MAVLGTLEVHLICGKDMKNVEFFGKNDPYALVSYKNQDQKSKTLEGGGSDPVWDQSFFFEVDDGAADVIIKIFDEDEHSADDAIGESKIPLSKVLTELEVPASTYDLVRPSGHTQGQVEVSLKFVPKATEPRPSASHHPKPQFHHNILFKQQHHSSNGPYGDNTEGGWQ